MTCAHRFSQLVTRGGAVVCLECKGELGAEAVLDLATDVIAERAEVRDTEIGDDVYAPQPGEEGYWVTQRRAEGAR